MPHKAFLKKKSLLDLFKDDYGGHTGYIQSARAEHTWSNPLTRRKRTNKLNGWIKSFAGKRHVHKLARFNAQQAGRNESYEDVKLDCLRYADILELPNGVCVKVNATIRCPRRAAFVFRITGIYDAEPENPSKYVIRGFYPVYGLERKPSEEFDIPCNDVSDIEQWVKSNEKGTRMQNEAMSLKGFIENLTEKLTKQFDLDEDEVKNYLDSHTEEMQILLDDKDMSLKEKVLFVRSEITGEKDEDKKSESVPESDYIQEFRSWLDAQEGEPYNEQEITDFGWEWKSQDVGYPNGNKTYYDYFSIEDDGVTYRLEVAWNSFNETIVGNKIWQDSSEAKTTDKSWQVDVSFDLDGNQEVAHVITDASSEAEAKKNAIAYVDSNYDGSTNVVIKDAKPLPKHKSERLFNKSEMERIALSEGSKVSPYLVEIAHKILKDEYGWKASTLEEVADWLGDHKQAFEHAYGQALRSSDDDKANVKAGIEAALDEEEQGVMNAEIAMMGESKKHEGFNTTRDLDNFALHILNYIKDKTHYPGYVRFVKLNDDEEDFYGKYFLSVNGKNYYLYVGDTDYSITDNNDENTLVEGSTDLSGAMNKDLDDFCERIQQPFYTESKEPAEEKLGYEKGHKNSKGEDAPWVIRSHKDNRVLASFPTKKEAEDQMQRMKQYSKQESKSADEFDKYIKDVKSLLKSKYGMDFNNRLNSGWMEKLDAMHYQGKSVEDCAKEVAAFCGYKKDESNKSEGFSLELIDTIKVPQWLWNAYNFDDTTDLEDDEIKKLDAFKEEYKFNHLDDRGEEAYFSSHNDFDSLGGNVYDVDVYKRSDMPTEKKNESIKDFPTNTGYKFTFGFQNPKTANVAINVAKEKGYACEPGRGTGFDDYSNVSIWVKEPQDAIRFADAIVNVANGENGVSLERSDVDKAFALAVKNNAGYKENKDAIDTAASQYALSIRPTESFDGLFILGELTDAVDFLEEIK